MSTQPSINDGADEEYRETHFPQLNQVTPLPEAARSDADSVPLQRVGSLCARWRANARAMEKLADECDDLDEEKDASECRERARTFRECANDLERKMAGTEATDQAHLSAPGGRVERNQKEQ